MVTQKQTRTKS